MLAVVGFSFVFICLGLKNEDARDICISGRFAMLVKGGETSDKSAEINVLPLSKYIRGSIFMFRKREDLTLFAQTE